jgi:exopolysaccharide biosynthesis polyprenyl glycosylphosphotransferase
MQQLCRRGWGVHSVLILGSGPLAIQVLQGVKKHPHFQAVGVLTEKKDTLKSWQKLPVWGHFKNIASVLKKHNIDEVWLATENTTSAITADLVAQAHVNHKKFKFFPDELGLDLAAVKVSTFDKFPIITLLNSPLYGWWSFVKHSLDFIFSFGLLILLSPILFIVSLAVWFTDFKAPIFYRSQRVGADGKCFKCYKFRTMVADAEAQKASLLKKNEREGGILFKLTEDPRITKLGHVLRKYSIDELPQLLNIIKGDMSFVGPRPHLVEEVNQYPEHNRQLLSLRPGLTGMAQINGRSSLSFEEEMKHEMFYLKNWSLWLDGVVVLKTIAVVLKGENAS